MTDSGNKLTTSQIAHRAADILLDKKGRHIVVLDVSRTSANLADFLIIATANNPRQAQAMAEMLVQDLKKAGVPRLSVTGLDYGWWVLVDFGDVVVHVMQDDARRYYDLETLWSDAPVIRRMEGDLSGVVEPLPIPDPE